MSGNQGPGPSPRQRSMRSPFHDQRSSPRSPFNNQEPSLQQPHRENFFYPRHGNSAPNFGSPMRQFSSKQESHSKHYPNQSRNHCSEASPGPLFQSQRDDHRQSPNNRPPMKHSNQSDSPNSESHRKSNFQPFPARRPVQAVRPQVFSLPPSKHGDPSPRRSPSISQTVSKPPTDLPGRMQSPSATQRQQSQHIENQTPPISLNKKQRAPQSLVSESYSDNRSPDITATANTPPISHSPQLTLPGSFHSSSGPPPPKNQPQTAGSASMELAPLTFNYPQSVYQPPPSVPTQVQGMPPLIYGPSMNHGTVSVPDFSLPPPTLTAKFQSNVHSTKPTELGAKIQSTSGVSPQPPLPDEPPPAKPPPPQSPPPPQPAMVFPGTSYIQPMGQAMWLGPRSFRPEWVSPSPAVMFTTAPPRFDQFRPRFRFLRPNFPVPMRYPFRMGMVRTETPMEFGNKKAKKRKHDNQENEDDTTMVREKKKKSMSKVYPARQWNQHDAKKALAAENQYARKDSRTLVVTFPEIDISRELVGGLHTAIEKVHFQIPGTARFCFVKIQDNEDVEAVMEELNKTKFLDMGYLKVERKPERPADDPNHSETIDPYTLYLGNLPLNINTTTVKEKFPTATRIDIGFAQRMKFTRYAFIRYQTVEDAIDAFRAATEMQFDSRTLIVRFRRQKAQIAAPNPPEQKLSKRLRKERKKLLEQKDQMEEMKIIISEKIKPEQSSLSAENIRKAQLSRLMFDDGHLSDDGNDDEDDFDEVDEEEDDDDDLPVPSLNNLEPKPISDDEEEEELVDGVDDEDDDDEREEEEEDDDRPDPPILPVKEEKIISEKTIKHEKPDLPVQKKQTIPDGGGYEEEDRGGDGDD